MSVGTVYCWGGEILGTPEPVVGLPTATKLTAFGYTMGCAISEDGATWCWDLSDLQAQQRLPSSPDAVAMSGYHVVRSDGTVWAMANTLEFEQVPDVQDAVDVAADIGYSLNHSCAQMTDGTVWCWGANPLGQLGDGTTVTPEGPVQVIGLEGVTGDASVMGLTRGDWHTCAWLSEGTAWCWGGNSSGQLGQLIPDEDHSPVPLLVNGLGNVQ